MNLALKEQKAVVGATAAATSALWCGTVDRTENETSHLHAALLIIRNVASGDVEEDAFEKVTFETK